MNELNTILVNIKKSGNLDAFKAKLLTSNIDELPALYIFGVLEYVQTQVSSEEHVQEIFDLLLLMCNKIGLVTKDNI